MAWIIAIAKALITNLKDHPIPSLAALLAAIVAGVVVKSFSGNIAALAILCLLIVVLLLIAVRNRRNELAALDAATVTAHDAVRLAAELSPEEKADVIGALQGVATEVANTTGIDRHNVRANLFGLGADGRLHIIPELTYNMERDEELGLSLAPGEGSTGRTFQTRKPNIAVLQSDWGPDTITDVEMDKIHPDLRWIVSVPILIGSSEHPLLILNVDGLTPIDDPATLGAAVPHMFHWAQFINIAIANAANREEAS